MASNAVRFFRCVAFEDKMKMSNVICGQSGQSLVPWSWQVFVYIVEGWKRTKFIWQVFVRASLYVELHYLAVQNWLLEQETKPQNLARPESVQR